MCEEEAETCMVNVVTASYVHLKTEEPCTVYIRRFVFWVRGVVMDCSDGVLMIWSVVMEWSNGV